MIAPTPMNAVLHILQHVLGGATPAGAWFKHILARKRKKFSRLTAVGQSGRSTHGLVKAVGGASGC
jgi:hypothetical protein